MKKSWRRIGIDWGSESHQVCRIDGEGEPTQRAFPHTGEGLNALVAFVVEGEMARDQVAIAIEVNHGAVVEALLAAGLSVYSINPKLLDRLRDRFSMPGAKDDRRDAFVLASCVESDAQAFRKIEVGNEENTRLQAATRLREDLKADLRANANRLWNELREYRPALLTLCPGSRRAVVVGLDRKGSVAIRRREAHARPYRRGSEAAPHPSSNRRGSVDCFASRHFVSASGLHRIARGPRSGLDRETETGAGPDRPNREADQDLIGGESEVRTSRAPRPGDPSVLAGIWIGNGGHGARRKRRSFRTSRLQRFAKHLWRRSHHQAKRRNEVRGDAPGLSAAFAGDPASRGPTGNPHRSQVP